MKLPYLSPAWTQALKSGLIQEITPQKGNITSSVVFRHNNVPGGGQKYLYVNVANGAVRAVESGEGPGPRAEFIISGDYDTFQQVLSGKLDPARALKSGKLRLQGNMMRALRMISFIETIMAEAGYIPTAF